MVQVEKQSYGPYVITKQILDTMTTVIFHQRIKLKNTSKQQN